MENENYGFMSFLDMRIGRMNSCSKHLYIEDLHTQKKIFRLLVQPSTINKEMSNKNTLGSTRKGYKCTRGFQKKKLKFSQTLFKTLNPSISMLSNTKPKIKADTMNCIYEVPLQCGDFLCSQNETVFYCKNTGTPNTNTKSKDYKNWVCRVPLERTSQYRVDGYKCHSQTRVLVQNKVLGDHFHPLTTSTSRKSLVY